MKRLCLFIILSVFCFYSCQRHTVKISSNNVIVSQKCQIKTENKRIASVSPQVTEILADLGCIDRLVCRTDFCVYPPQVSKIPSIGGINNANIEKIISLNPDIVITSTIFTKKMFVAIEDANIPIISFREGSHITDMYNVISTLGEIVGKQNTADSLINDCKKRLNRVKITNDSILKAKGNKKPKVYYVVGFGAGGDFSAGKDTYIHEIISLAGGDNIAKISKGWSFNKEELFKNQPDYIFVRKNDVETFISTSPYNSLEAVKKRHVYGIESLDNQTPQSIDAIEYIASIIHSK